MSKPSSLTLAASICACALMLGGCSDTDAPGTAASKTNSAAPKAAAPAVNPNAAVVSSLAPQALQADLTTYWELNNGTEAAFIYNGKSPDPDSMPVLINALGTGGYYRGTDELSELFDKRSKTSDEFVKKDLEKEITPLLQAQIDKFGGHAYYKQTLSAHTIDMQPYDFEKEEFPLTSTLFASLEEQLRSASTPNKYKISNSQHHYLGFYDARDFRMGFANGERLKAIKVSGEEARAIEAVRAAQGGGNLELRVYGYIGKTIKGDAKVTDKTRTVLMTAQYIELVDKNSPDHVLYHQTL